MYRGLDGFPDGGGGADGGLMVYANRGPCTPECVRMLTVCQKECQKRYTSRCSDPNAGQRERSRNNGPKRAGGGTARGGAGIMVKVGGT